MRWKKEVVLMKEQHVSEDTLHSKWWCFITLSKDLEEEARKIILLCIGKTKRNEITWQEVSPTPGTIIKSDLSKKNPAFECTLAGRTIRAAFFEPENSFSNLHCQITVKTEREEDIILPPIDRIYGENSAIVISRVFRVAIREQIEGEVPLSLLERTYEFRKQLAEAESPNTNS